MKNTLEKISKFGVELLVPLTASQLYPLIVDAGVKLVSGDYGSILIKQGKEFKRIYTTSPIPYHSRVRQRAYAYRAYIQGKILIVPAAKTIKAHPELKKLDIKYTIHVPLSYKKQSIGVLIINSKNEKMIGKEDIVALKLLGSMASLAIRKAQLYDETQAALQARDHFISMASHELRTPLTSVDGYIQLLYTKLAKADTAESRWIEQLYEESKRLKNLVNELLEIDRIKSGKLNYFLRVVSLRDILETVKKNAQFTFPGKDVLVEDRLGDLSDNVIADHDKIIQVFTNLVENAVKYSYGDFPIQIVLDFKDSDFVILVKDKGIGIPKKDYERIFEGYQQCGPNKEGLGLGLFLVKNILTKLGGSIKVRSRVGKGTTMRVRLPKANI